MHVNLDRLIHKTVAYVIFEVIGVINGKFKKNAQLLYVLTAFVHRRHVCIYAARTHEMRAMEIEMIFSNEQAYFSIASNQLSGQLMLIIMF